VAAIGTRPALLLLAGLAAFSVLYFPDYIHVAIITPFVLVPLAGLAHRARTALPALATAPGRVAVAAAWLAVAALVARKATTNVQLARNYHPVRVESAFGTLDAPAYYDEVTRELQRLVPTGAERPARLFAYPADAWLYLALPADNPTRFALLRPRYSTPEQIEEARAALLADPQARVVVNLFLTAPDDPMLPWLRANYVDAAGLGPANAQGVHLYRLFVPRGAAGSQDADPASR
jgi:hypothetical protein